MYITCLAVLGWAGIGLTSTSSWLGWPRQPVQWDILYCVMSGSVFKWGAGWSRGFYYLGASWASGGENTTCCICFFSVLLIVVFISLCHSVKPFPSQPMSFLLSFWFSAPSHWGGGRSERAAAWFFMASWSKTTTLAPVNAEILHIW